MNSFKTTNLATKMNRNKLTTQSFFGRIAMKRVVTSLTRTTDHGMRIGCSHVLVLAACVYWSVAQTPAAVGQSFLDFNDGGSHTIDYYTGDDVYVRVDLGSPGRGTQLEVVEGGRIDEALYGYEDSVVTISGGELSWVIVRDRSGLAFDGGTINVALWASDESVVSVSGGVVNGTLVAHDSPRVTMSGGMIEQLDAYENSTITVSGGSIGPNLRTNVAVTSWHESRVTISGGTIQGKIHAGWYADAGPSAIIFEGSNFTVDGIPVGYGEIYSVHGGHWPDEPVRRLTGVLSSGDAINNDFYISGNARIVLIPEPSTVGLTVIGLIGAFVKRRRARIESKNNRGNFGGPNSPKIKSECAV